MNLELQLLIEKWKNGLAAVVNHSSKLVIVTTKHGIQLSNAEVEVGELGESWVRSSYIKELLEGCVVGARLADDVGILEVV